MTSRRCRAVATVFLLAALPGCWSVHAATEGFQRLVDAADVEVPPGYRIEAVTTGLSFPTGVTFDETGRAYVVEAGDATTPPRLLRVDGPGKHAVVASGTNPPWTGASYHAGAFVVAEGGDKHGGRILRIGLDGRTRVLADGLPSMGDHHTNGPVVGPDGYVYFGQGTATNAGVVGTDNWKFGWLKRYRGFHDIPAQDVTLAGLNYASEDPRRPGSSGVATGAYLPFGTASEPGEVIKGQLPFTGGIMRVPATGGPLQMVAWGMRNPFALAFAPDGTLYAAENGIDERGSRPVASSGDCLWKVTPGTWYGWPDFAMGEPVAAKRPGGFLLADHPNPPPWPAALFGIHAAADGLTFARGNAFGFPGEAFVAEYGETTPWRGKPLWQAGFRVVRVDPRTGVVTDFATNKGRLNGPASRLGRGGLERPIDAKFDPAVTALYVVDYGIPTRPQTGVLWRIIRST